MATRSVDAIVPPLERTRAAGTGGIVAVVQHWLDHELPALAGEVVPASHLGHHLINGKTYLHNRDLLARAIFDAFPDYRGWLLAELEPELRARYRAALPPEFTDAQVETVVRARLERPRIQDLERRLAAWHEDVGARELAFELQRVWAEALPDDPDERRRRLESLRGRWRVLARWLRPPDRVRVVTPLLLAYDPRREAFGFYRLALPRLRQMPSLDFPDRPVALELYARLTSDPPPPATPAAAGQPRWLEADHHRLAAGELPWDAFPQKETETRDLRRVRLGLSWNGADVTVDLVVEADDDGIRPFCAHSRSGEPPAAWKERLDRLAGPSCRELAGAGAP